MTTANRHLVGAPPPMFSKRPTPTAARSSKRYRRGVPDTGRGCRRKRRSQHGRRGSLIDGDALVIATLDRLRRSTQNMLAFAEQLRARVAGLRVLNLGGGDVDTSTQMGSMLFTIMAALAQIKHEIKRERDTDSIAKATRSRPGPWRPPTPHLRQSGAQRATPRQGRHTGSASRARPRHVSSHLLSPLSRTQARRQLTEGILEARPLRCPCPEKSTYL